MAKRFGRNQKRKLREEVASAQRAMGAIKHTCHQMAEENAGLKARLRRSIEIDVDCLRDHARLTYDARVKAAMLPHPESLYVMKRIDDREASLHRDRDRFIQHVSTMLATELARAIGGRW